VPDLAFDEEIAVVEQHRRRDFLRCTAVGAGAVGMSLGAQGAALAADNGPQGKGEPGPVKRASPWARASYIRATVRRPHFPNRWFDVMHHGAVGDGSTDNSAAIRAAIAACHAAGGGHVVVPAGAFTTGPIHLLSNVDLHVTKDARILFSQRPADYLPAVLTRFEGVEVYNYSPLIYAYGQENIAVTGAGSSTVRRTTRTGGPGRARRSTAGRPGTLNRGPSATGSSPWPTPVCLSSNGSSARATTSGPPSSSRTGAATC
jgi:polygalacturonase